MLSLHNISYLFCFHSFSFFLSMIRTVTRSCYSRGYRSLSLCSVRISFFCFSKSNDLRICLSQVENSPVLTDKRRLDTARNVNKLPPKLCLGFPYWFPCQVLPTDGWWHQATIGVPFCMCLSVFVTHRHTHIAFAFHIFTHSKQSQKQTKG